MDVFVYGTLTDPAQVDRVLPTAEFRGPAVLSGLHRVEGQYPTLAPGGETKGKLLQTDDLTPLDRYEGADRGLYCRVAVPVEGDDDTEAAVYVGDPDALGVLESVAWPAGDEFASRVRQYVSTGDVRVRRLDE